ncbi:amino acid adenylation domain-containing protein [Brevibacillus sp. VP]|nr:amino acid adenylation domain-containing protein [Brevibacillus sp. VP]
MWHAKQEKENFFLGEMQSMGRINVSEDRMIVANQKAKERDYWQMKLAGEVTECHFPYDQKNQESPSEQRDDVKNVVDGPSFSQLIKLSNGSDIRLHMILTSVLNVLLYKYTGHSDIVVVSPVLKQDTEANFINTVLVLRNQLREEMTCKELLLLTREMLNEATENQNYPLLSLYEQIMGHSRSDHSSLFHVGILLENIHDHSYLVSNQPEVLFSFLKTNDSLELKITFSTARYHRASVERIAAHYKGLLQNILDNLDTPLSVIDMLSMNEKLQIRDFNDTQIEFPAEKNLYELFTLQAEKTPDVIAVADDNRQLTYAELKERATQAAYLLKKKGIQPEKIVGVMLKRNIDIVVSILAILQVGGAYLPINPSLPKNRIQSMLDDTNSPLLITNEEVVTDSSLMVDLPDLEVLSVTELLSYKTSETEEFCRANPSQLAYVIFTSGSTGKPKGTMIEQRSVVNLIWGLNRELYTTYPSPLRVAMVSPLEFDASIQNMFGSLLNGHSLLIVPEDARVEGEKLVAFYRKHQIELSDGTPTHLRILGDYLNKEETADLALKHLLIAGEALTAKVVANFVRHFSHKPKILNAYGPTETCVDSTSYHVILEEIDSVSNISIGRPLANQQVFIVNENNQLQPIGIPGELCIAGEGLARGYLNRPELTEMKFTQNPFIDLFPQSSQRMYRTGDLARWLPDGNIEYLGRFDEQVKIRGMRIEMGEIESRLLTFSGMKEAVVIGLDSKASQETYLCAYVVADHPVVAREVRAFLSKDLPIYMVPTYIIQVDTLPITSNGKLNRKMLPHPEDVFEQMSKVQYVAARNETEATLVEIWQNILSTDQIGVHENFFELGGHSLNTTTLVSRIMKTFHVEVPLQVIFQHPTIEELAIYIDQGDKKQYEAIDLVEKRDYYPVSSAQQRLFVMNKFEGVGTSYNIPGALIVEGELDRKRFEQAIWGLVQRHESLRTSFVFLDGVPVQKVQDHATIDVWFQETTEEQIESIIDEFIRPFDLREAPLLRVGLVKLNEYRHLLLFDMHHVISDGVSMIILQQDFIKLYAQEELSPMSIQYKDYAAWQRKRMESDEMGNQEAFWLKTFEGEIPILQLPTDFPRLAKQSFDGNRVIQRIPDSLVKQLSDLTESTGTTLYIVLLAAYNVLLHKYTKQTEIIVGSPIAGRVHADTEQMVGMFVNTLAMKNSLHQDKPFSLFLQEVKENALQAYENQEYPFEELINKLQLERDNSRNPLFDTMLIMQNIPSYHTQANTLTFTPFDYKHKTSKFDITFEFFQEKDGLLLHVEYVTKLFKQETIERMVNHFLAIIAQILRNPSINLSEIELLTQAEKDKILYQFNNTREDYPKDKQVHQLFEEQAKRNPKQTALIFENQTYTYEFVNERANQLARKLRGLGIGREEVVGLRFDRSVEMILGILAVMKAGAAYVAIDPDYPAEHAHYILADSNAQVLVTETKHIDTISFMGPILDLNNEALYEGDTANLETISTADSLAYILYTSGSTGRPKGVMIEHGSIVNYLFAMQKDYPMAVDDAYLLKTPYTFDVSVLELFGWFISGGSLVILEPGGHRNPKSILRVLESHNVALVNFVPSMFKVFLNSIHEESITALTKLKYVLVAGEAISHDVVEQFYSLTKNVTLDNLYGPTEATVIATRFPLRKAGEYSTLPIGKPIQNVQVYVMNESTQLEPIGIVGELFIAGAGVARGYLNKPELNEEKFVSNPFAASEKMYRTGDLARWLPDGNIEFLGRIDHQVKIRGYRIELEEIETRLRSYEGIADAVVLDKDDSLGNKQLVAYIITANPIDMNEIKEHLRKQLPSFMIPAHFMTLDKLPLTTSGKVNRGGLQDEALLFTPRNREGEEPKTVLEMKLMEIWKRVLKVEQVGTNEDFFEHGGNSLLAVTLDLEMEKEELISDDLVVYEHRTIQALAAFIEQKEPTNSEAEAPMKK